MGNNRWLARQLYTAQVDTLTIGGAAGVGQVYTATINTKNVSYTATVADTNATILTALLALLQAVVDGDYAEITWANPTATTITATAKNKGKPFTLTAAESGGGTGTLTRSSTVANTSPNDVGDVANWSLGALPVNGDSVFIDNTDASLWWNLDALSAVATITALTVGPGFRGTIGLPERAGPSNPTRSFPSSSPSTYEEYRVRYLKLKCTTITINAPDCQLIQIDNQAVQTAITVRAMGSPLDTDRKAFIWKGTHASNAITLEGGCSLDCAVFGDEVATILTLIANAGANGTPDVRISPAVTLGTVQNNGGNLDIACAIGTAITTTPLGGSVILRGTGAVAAATFRGGNITYNTTGTLSGTTIVSGNTVVDFSQEPTTKTIGTFNLYGNAAQIIDTNKVVSSLVVKLFEGATAGQVDWGFTSTLTRT
jgi:hypothetical protein